MKDTILIIDFGSGYKDFLIKAVEDLEVDVKVFDNDILASKYQKTNQLKELSCQVVQVPST